MQLPESQTGKDHVSPDYKVSVILPTYEERQSIVPLISEILLQVPAAGYDTQVVVVDDDSPDQTAQAVRDAFGGNPAVKLVVRVGERGLASAIWRGIREADGQVVVCMDTDFNHHPRYIPRLLATLDGADLALGSRFVPGGGMKTSRLRWLCSRVFNLFLRLLLGVSTTDNLSGFLAVRKADLQRLDHDFIYQGYGDYAIRLMFLAQRAGMRVREIPVVYEHRMGGESKTRFVHHLLEYTKSAWILRRRWGKR